MIKYQLNINNKQSFVSYKYKGLFPTIMYYGFDRSVKYKILEQYSNTNYILIVSASLALCSSVYETPYNYIITNLNSNNKYNSVIDIVKYNKFKNLYNRKISKYI